MTEPVTADLPMQLRAGSFAPATVDADKRTIELVWTTGARVPRRDWWTGRRYDEELVISENAVDLTRMKNGAPLLDAHNTYALAGTIGVVERAWIEKGEGRAIVRFSPRAEVDPIWQDVRAGILRNVSVGYHVRKYEIEEVEGHPALYRAVEWEPHEISLVPVGADAGAGTRTRPATVSAPHAATFPCVFSRAAAPTTETPMTKPNPAGGAPVVDAASLQAADTVPAADATRAAPAPTPPAPVAPPAPDTAAIRAEAAQAERARSAEIRKIGKLGGLDEAAIDKLIDAGTPIEAARSAVFEAMAARAPEAPRPGVTVLADETDKRRELVEGAILHRHNPAAFKLENGAGDWRGRSLMEIGEELLRQQGVSTRGMDKMRRAAMILGMNPDGGQRAGPGYHTTSDFPFILANVGNKALRRAYMAAPQTFKPFTRPKPLPDFKQASWVQLGDAPALLEVKENGEFKRGTVGEGREVWQLATYGRIFPINRQTLVNDDLDAFTRLPEMFGRKAADLESDIVWGVINDNAVMGDSVALFDTATHGNLASTATAPAVASLGAARQAMRKQTSLDGSYLNIEARFIMVPPELETVTQQLLAAVIAAQASNVNPFSNAYVQITEPRLSVNPTAWYMSADPAQIDTIVWGHLEGQEGVFLESRLGFDIDGVELKARLDFGAKALDWRGLYKNAG